MAVVVMGGGLANFKAYNDHALQFLKPDPPLQLEL